MHSNVRVLVLLAISVCSCSCVAPQPQAIKSKNDPFECVPQAGPSLPGNWVPIPQLTDEFEGTRLDEAKWHNHNPGWLGRKPGFFSTENVEVHDGKLHLTARMEEPPDETRPKGYHTFTTAAVQSKTKVLYGYFETKCKPMKSHASSAFWFYQIGPNMWTEIDVFEIGGGADLTPNYVPQVIRELSTFSAVYS